MTCVFKVIRERLSRRRFVIAPELLWPFIQWFGLQHKLLTNEWKVLIMSYDNYIHIERPVFYPCASVAVPVCWQGRGVALSAVWCRSHCRPPPLLPLLLLTQTARTLPRLWHHQPVNQRHIDGNIVRTSDLLLSTVSFSLILAFLFSKRSEGANWRRSSYWG